MMKILNSMNFEITEYTDHKFEFDHATSAAAVG